MDDYRKNNIFTESGIALIVSLIVALASIAIMGGIFYVLRSGIQVALMSRQYTSTHEAASGGIEYAAAVIKRVSKEEELVGIEEQSLGISGTEYTDIIYRCDTSKTMSLHFKTPSESGRNQFDLVVTIQCLAHTPIPGSESLIFPPPPSGGGTPHFYVFYRIETVAKEADTNRISNIEAVYKASM